MSSRTLGNWYNNSIIEKLTLQFQVLLFVKLSLQIFIYSIYVLSILKMILESLFK